MRSRFSLVVVCLTWFFAQPPGLNAQELEFETFLITTFGSLGFVTGRDYAGNPLDLNWDGKVDFLVAYRSGDYVSSFISDGPTEYRETQTAIEGRRPFTLAVADLDRDYLNDVVTANDQSGSLSVLHGAGFGSFPLGFEIPQAGAPRSIVAADFDGDGWVDVAYATIGAPVAIHVLANEFGALNPTPVYMQYFSGRLGYVAAPDMDRDGDPDLVVVTTDFFTGFIDVFRNEGGFLFEHFDSILLPFPVNPRTLATGDLNGDGYMDVAVGNWLPDESVDAFFVLNDGEGRFDLDTVSVIEVPGIGESVTIDDFNLDTHADLAVSADGNFPFGVTIFLNDGAANFDPTASVQLNSGDRPRWLTSVDIDGDGDVDLASANLDFVGLIVHQNLFMESALAVEVVAWPPKAAPATSRRLRRASSVSRRKPAKPARSFSLPEPSSPTRQWPRPGRHSSGGASAAQVRSPRARSPSTIRYPSRSQILSGPVLFSSTSSGPKVGWEAFSSKTMVGPAKTVLAFSSSPWARPSPSLRPRIPARRSTAGTVSARARMQRARSPWRRTSPPRSLRQAFSALAFSSSIGGASKAVPEAYGSTRRTRAASFRAVAMSTQPGL